jgi:hypothetical protein
MDATRRISIVIALLFSALALAAEPQPAAAPASATAPAAAPATAAVLDPVDVEEKQLTPEQRQERAFRTVQEGMARERSDKVEDENLIVCKKEKPTGSNMKVINCATNAFWKKIRSSSMAAGIAGGGMTAGGTGAYGSGGGGSAKKDDKVITISVSAYYEMEKKFGKAPKKDDSKP